MNDPLGHYQMVRRLAVGGMGEVLLARFGGDEEIEPGLVVVKRTLQDHPSQAHQDAMLREEARLAVRLRHENLVETFRLDEASGTPLLIMEYLAGRSLSQVLGAAKRNQAPLPIAACVKVLRAAACGLHFAHTLKDGARPLGLVHRDVSPANVLVTFDGRVKVIDFGVAKADDSEIRTSTGILKGKIGYMSPEHARGEKLDPRSDLWSLGVVLWEMLVADRLFSGPNPAITLHNITGSRVPSPRERRPEIPRPLEELCLCLLTRERGHRVQSGKELVQLIDQLPQDLARDADLGSFLAERFPEEAEQGRREAQEASRARRRTPIPRGLVEGEAPAIDDVDDVAPTQVLDGAALAALTRVEPEAGAKATVEEDVADAPTAILPPVSDAEVAPAAPRRSAEPGEADRTLATVVERKARLPEVAGQPSSVALPAQAPAQARRSAPSALTVALITFGLIAAAMGGVFAALAERRAPAPVFLAGVQEGSLVVVARREDLPPGLPLERLGQLDPRAPPDGLGLAPAALSERLAESGVLARARLPKSRRATIAAALPLGIFGLGVLALALALPGLFARRSRALSLALPALLVVAVSGLLGLCVKRGALGWPGTDALAPPKEPPRLVLPIPRGAPRAP